MVPRKDATIRDASLFPEEVARQRPQLVSCSAVVLVREVTAVAAGDGVGPAGCAGAEVTGMQLEEERRLCYVSGVCMCGGEDSLLGVLEFEQTRAPAGLSYPASSCPHLLVLATPPAFPLPPPNGLPAPTLQLWMVPASMPVPPASKCILARCLRHCSSRATEWGGRWRRRWP